MKSLEVLMKSLEVLFQSLPEVRRNSLPETLSQAPLAVWGVALRKLPEILLTISNVFVGMFESRVYRHVQLVGHSAG